jgi:delta 1-pyrroline-5-carboxylate dehydrogenase
VMKPPKDLKPNEEVFQVRFTKEIFRDYQDYLSCMNLYRRRVWTCKVSGKSNLTYEEAVVSERKATEKVQQFPKEFMGPVLHLVQFSCVIFLSSPCLWNIEI